MISLLILKPLLVKKSAIWLAAGNIITYYDKIKRERILV